MQNVCRNKQRTVREIELYLEIWFSNQDEINVTRYIEVKKLISYYCCCTIWPQQPIVVRNRCLYSQKILKMEGFKVLILLICSNAL